MQSQYQLVDTCSIKSLKSCLTCSSVTYCARKSSCVRSTSSKGHTEMAQLHGVKDVNNGSDCEVQRVSVVESVAVSHGIADACCCASPQHSLSAIDGILLSRLYLHTVGYPIHVFKRAASIPFSRPSRTCNFRPL
jgi:hypothetical protein